MVVDYAFLIFMQSIEHNIFLDGGGGGVPISICIHPETGLVVSCFHSHSLSPCRQLFEDTLCMLRYVAFQAPLIRGDGHFLRMIFLPLILNQCIDSSLSLQTSD